MVTMTIARTDCAECHGAGVLRGFGSRPGVACLCVAHCCGCDEPFAWDRSEGRPPRYCASCRTIDTTGEEIFS